jgi:hypothetical protein
MKGKYCECRYVPETLPCHGCGKSVQYMHVVGVDLRASAGFCATCAERVVLRRYRGITPRAESMVRDRVAEERLQPVTECQVFEMYMT